MPVSSFGFRYFGLVLFGLSSIGKGSTSLDIGSLKGIRVENIESYGRNKCKKQYQKEICMKRYGLTC